MQRALNGYTTRKLVFPDMYELLEKSFIPTAKVASGVDKNKYFGENVVVKVVGVDEKKNRICEKK